MGNTIELTCGHCRERMVIPNGKFGMVYVCQRCGGQTRAARQTVTAGAKKPLLPSWCYIFAIGGVVGIFVAWFQGGQNESTADQQSVGSRNLNEVAFVTIGEAQADGDFRSLAARTESALAVIEELASRTKEVADLDPRLRKLARMQAEYGRAMATAVATDQEAYEHPERVPLELWRLQLEYHQAARRMAAKHRPDWVEGLDMRIEHDKKMIRRFE